VFQATVQGITTSHKRAQERLTAAHKEALAGAQERLTAAHNDALANALASHKDAQQRLERQINALQKRLQTTNDDLKTAAVTIRNNATAHTVCPRLHHRSVVH
jgi:vacuolar-type H+-ATPase subunit E/Vma4